MEMVDETNIFKDPNKDNEDNIGNDEVPAAVNCQPLLSCDKDETIISNFNSNNLGIELVG